VILSSGERAVWAAAFARERAERLADLSEEDLEYREARGEALSPYQEAIHGAIKSACGAVEDLRVESAEWLSVGVVADHEMFLMLRAMLGEE